MIISQHADVKNIIGKQRTDYEALSPTVYVWDSTFIYSSGSIINYSGILYDSLQSANTNKVPNVEMSWWEVYKTPPKPHTHPTSDIVGLTFDAVSIRGIPVISGLIPTSGQALVYSPSQGGYIPSIVSVSGVGGSSGGGAVGADGIVEAGNTDVVITFSGLQTSDYNRAVVSPVGANGAQRSVFVLTPPTNNGSNLDVEVGIDSSYTEDITVHVVLAKE